MCTGIKLYSKLSYIHRSIIQYNKIDSQHIDEQYTVLDNDGQSINYYIGYAENIKNP